MKTWTIWLDGQPYGGESPAAENAHAAAVGGWSGKQPATRSGVRIGEGPAKLIAGRTNLRSEVDRIMSRIAEGVIDPTEITIRRHQSHENSQPSGGTSASATCSALHGKNSLPPDETANPQG